MLPSTARKMPRHSTPNEGYPSPVRPPRSSGRVVFQRGVTLPALPSLSDVVEPDTLKPGTLRLNGEIRVALHDRAAALGVPMEALANTLLAIALKALKDRQSPPPL